VILPLILMIAAGYVVHKAVGLDLRTLSRVNVYLLVPCFIFSHLYHFRLGLREAGSVIAFTWAVMAGVGLLAYLLARWRKLPRSLAVAFVVATIFYNSGNYGLTVIELVFGEDSEAVDLQALVLTSQNVLSFTIGAFFISTGARSVKDSLRKVAKYPILPAVVGAVAFRLLDVPLPHFVDVPLGRMAGALAPIGLATLGAQLANVSQVSRLVPLVAASVMRLCVGPVVGLALIYAAGFDGLLAQVLLISSCVPTAVNSAILSIEFDAEADFASQAVVLSTVLSMVTVPVVVSMALRMF
jgi:malate permease and related proteins